MNRAFGGLLACACLSIAGPVQAEDTQEFWPELAAFVQLNDRARACFDVAYSASEEFDVQSKVLARTRERLRELETRVEALEAKLRQ